MKKSTLLWIGVGAAFFTGLGIYLYKKSKPSETSTGETEADAGTTDSSASPNNNNGGVGGLVNAVMETIPTPFKNKEQGDAFRRWVNTQYPDYAKKNKLDPSGDYDNRFIRKAFREYGKEYDKYVTDMRKQATGMKKGTLLYSKGMPVGLYSYPKFGAENLKISVPNSALPFGNYEQDSSVKGWISVLYNGSQYFTPANLVTSVAP